MVVDSVVLIDDYEKLFSNITPEEFRHFSKEEILKMLKCIKINVVSQISQVKAS